MPGDDAAPPAVSVIILAYQAGAYLERCLDALARQTYRDFETLLLDNGSTDGAVAAAAANADRRRLLNLRTIDLGSNLGFAAGNNRGVEAARGQWLALLNPDAFPAVDWLEKMIRGTDRYPDAVAFGSLQRVADDPTLLDGAGDAYHPFGLAWRGGFGHDCPARGPEGEVFGPCAAAALYRTDWFRRIGGFDEDFFCYHEDVDLAFRLRLQGGTCVQLGDAVVEHVGSGISGRASDFSIYHGTRNRLWTFHKNMPAGLLALFFPGHLLLSCLLLARALGNGTAGPTARGMVAGLKGVARRGRKRRSTQEQRSVSSWSLLKAMTWSPMKAARRAIDVRPG